MGSGMDSTTTSKYRLKCRLLNSLSTIPTIIWETPRMTDIFIYNEALSLSPTLFGPSAFDNGPNYGDSPPYPMGVDPVWRHSENNIQFTNSLKMKMSVILGVSQMMVGIVLKLFNNLHF